MKTFISDLYKRPTFVSILGILLYVIMIPLIIYQMMTLDESSSLVYVLEIIFLLIFFFIVLIDRFLLEYINDKLISILEFLAISSFLIYYYISHNISFSIG